jgi:hypothetical protein
MEARRRKQGDGSKDGSKEMEARRRKQGRKARDGSKEAGSAERVKEERRLIFFMGFIIY